MTYKIYPSSIEIACCIYRIGKGCYPLSYQITITTEKFLYRAEFNPSPLECHSTVNAFDIPYTRLYCFTCKQLLITADTLTVVQNILKLSGTQGVKTYFNSLGIEENDPFQI